ncbi:Facilitated trehalose transporter Tret1-like 25 [Homarus americanus]|uniref:Facilitated trehalose transporter Tret1-like 25 n=1 Tax=Homarus americanus TaxID=6706 RepID=A0A8J5MMC7_HOMAM|nr:Facilitated trehalose transporter Tret1-like 25 [Homarus americanus]
MRCSKKTHTSEQHKSVMDSNSTSITSISESIDSRDTVNTQPETITAEQHNARKYVIGKDAKEVMESTCQLEKSGSRKHLLSQGVTCFLASLGMWVMGSILVYPSVLSSDLFSHNTTIYGTHIAFTNFQMDAVGGLVSLGSLPGSWAIGAVMVVKGRRFAMAIVGVVAVISWLGVALLDTIPGFLLARLLSGMVAGGASVALNTYKVEVASPEMRGVIAVIFSTGITTGQLVIMGVGYKTRYYNVALIIIVIPIIFLLGLFCVPESPSYLVLKGHEDRAKEVLMKLRGSNADIQAEINSYHLMNQEHKKQSVWRGLLQPQALKSIAIVSTLFLFQNFTGYLVINANASRFFSETASSINEYFCAFLLILIQVVVGIIPLFLADTIGRRKSLILSFSIAMLALTGMAVFVSVTEGNEAPSLRYGWAASICFSINTLLAFMALQLYTPMLEGLTQAGLYLCYSSSCLLGILFTIFFVRETMGQNIG